MPGFQGKRALLEFALVGALRVVTDRVDVARERVVSQAEWPNAQRGPTLLERHLSAVKLNAIVRFNQSIGLVNVGCRSFEGYAVDPARLLEFQSVIDVAIVDLASIAVGLENAIVCCFCIAFDTGTDCEPIGANVQEVE